MAQLFDQLPYLLHRDAGHAEQANVRIRRYGRRNIPPYSAAEPGGSAGK